MQTIFVEVGLFVFFVPTALLLLVGGYTIYYFSIIQRKKLLIQKQEFEHEKEIQLKEFQHEREKSELRETFNKTLLQSKIEIQEQTLDYVGKELHANISHQATLVNMGLTGLLPNSNSEQQEKINDLKVSTRQLMADIKSLSASLNSDHIMHIGFIKAIDNELKRIGKLTDCQVVFTKAGQDFRLRPEHEIILFRLCQEILNNVIKHATASSVNVSLRNEENRFVIEIKDDGIGFDIETALMNSAEKTSTGLVNIKKRAKLIDAEINIQSQISKGSIFTIIIPIK